MRDFLAHHYFATIPEIIQTPGPSRRGGRTHTGTTAASRSRRVVRDLRKAPSRPGHIASPFRRATSPSLSSASAAWRRIVRAASA
jgi:hypothetical protein